MSDHTRPGVPVLMETLILFLIWDMDHRLIKHTTGTYGNGLLLAVIILWMLISVWFSLIGSAKHH